MWPGCVRRVQASISCTVADGRSILQHKKKKKCLKTFSRLAMCWRMQKTRRHTAKKQWPEQERTPPARPHHRGPTKHMTSSLYGVGLQHRVRVSTKDSKTLRSNTLIIHRRLLSCCFFNQDHQFDGIILNLAQIFSAYDQKWLQQTKEKQYNYSINSPFLNQSVLATSKHLAAVNWWFPLKSNFFLLLSDTNSVCTFIFFA